MAEARSSGCYLILSLDGGGVRGALQARIVERLEDSIPFLDKVELIAGSSIGGIASMCLAAGYQPADLVSLFKDRMADIFKKRDWLDSIAGGADEVFRANFGSEGAREILEDLLGEKTLGDLDKRVLITAFDLDNQDAASKESATRIYKRRFWKPKFFHNYDSPGNDRDQTTVDVGLRTGAAPTYFPSHQGFIDGGLVANNPSLCALARAVKSGVPQENIVILSIGTGRNPTYIEGDCLDWGLKQWAPRLLPLLFDAMVGYPNYICDQLLPARYVRINPFLPEDVDLAAADRVDDLIEWANDVDLSEAVDLLSHLPV